MTVAARNSAVRLYAPDHPELANTVAKRLHKEMAPLAQAIADGCAISFDDYRYRCGVLRGMQAAIDICKEIDKELR